jgi:(1->4)-alpha-D-glucan 1-alpha-D-glucosylmutase
VAKLEGGTSAASWADTRVSLPPGRWRDHLSGTDVDGAVSAAFARFPVALLTRVA